MQTRTNNHNRMNGRKGGRTGAARQGEATAQVQAAAVKEPAPAARADATESPADRTADGAGAKATSPTKMVLLVFFIPILVIVALGFAMR